MAHPHAALMPQHGRNRRVPLRGTEDQDQLPQSAPLHVWVPPPVQNEDQRPQFRPRPSSTQVPPPKEAMLQHPSSSLIRPPGEFTEGEPHYSRHPQEHRPHSSHFLPRDRQTNPLAWSTATICVIVLVTMIVGGLMVLIVYLVYRPRSPLFDLNGVTLNAAALDMGYLLNADVSLLANFTNPNRKVSIDFSRMYLSLYFENSLIATQYIEPFSAAKGETMFAHIHMITTQVKLSMEETVLFRNQIENNQVLLTVKGVFRARSKLEADPLLANHLAPSLCFHLVSILIEDPDRNNVLLPRSYAITSVKVNNATSIPKSMPRRYHSPDLRTHPTTWCAATLVLILLLIIVVVSLVLVVVYFGFRPRSPVFDLNSVTLNAASVDMDYQLNANFTLVANFTNPNRKASFNFSRTYLDLYFEKTLIATQNIEPFSAVKGQSMFPVVHMIASQVRLSLNRTLVFRNQIKNNRIIFTIKGVFRARSELGTLMRYEYWLHGYCGIVVSSPPTWVLREKHCMTHRTRIFL
ncbi:hypothetical protein V6N13_080784 [Hibiscus sabdariffa]|uniref:Uncharacterized protein n=2 Tax=Hibiscus sabdariffa TaxID=183260 RepID=A0ABR2CB72_9ROSI